MNAYRIALTPFCDASGEGAKLFGGRWNSPGIPTVYASSSLSACLLERLTVDPELLSAERFLRYSVMEFELPDDLILKPHHEELPMGWDHIPALKASIEYGSNLLKSGILGFMVPSVVDPSSMNFVINPNSQDFNFIQYKIYPLQLDKRIIR